MMFAPVPVFLHTRRVLARALSRDNILRVRGLETTPYSSKMRETIIVMPCNGVIYGIPYS